MTTYENQPPLEGWQVEPRPCPIFDLVTRVKAKLEALDIPPNVTLGDN